MVSLLYAKTSDEWFINHVDFWLQQLSNEERHRYNRFRATIKAQQFLLSRSLIKLYLKSKGHCLASAYVINNYRALRLEDGSCYFVSISHSGQYACVLASRLDIRFGVDIELQKKRDFLALAQYSLNLAEQELLNTRTDLTSSFYSIWTAKEALTKALNLELLDVLRHVDLTCIVLNDTARLSYNRKHFSFFRFISGDWIVSVVLETNETSGISFNCLFNHEDDCQLIIKQVESLGLLR